MNIFITLACFIFFVVVYIFGVPYLRYVVVNEIIDVLVKKSAADKQFA